MGAQRKRRSDRITPRIARAGQSQQAVIPLGPAAIFFRLFELPGVVVHEFAHYFFCRLAGSKVHEAVFFSLGNPAGYIVHSVPRHIRQHALIVLGPFLVNTSIAYALFRLQGETGFGAEIVYEPATLVRSLLALWLGVSIAIQAIPSRADIDSLYDVVKYKLANREYLAGLGLVLAIPFSLANILRPLWIEWIYAAGLASVALVPDWQAIFEGFVDLLP